eukprot:sb/3474650/
MCPGDKRRLTIPPEYGYGVTEIGPVPPNSALQFEVELLHNGYPNSRHSQRQNVTSFQTKLNSRHYTLKGKTLPCSRLCSCIWQSLRKVGFFEVVTPLLSRGVVFARDSPHLLSLFGEKTDITGNSIILGVRKTLV